MGNDCDDLKPGDIVYIEDSEDIEYRDPSYRDPSHWPELTPEQTEKLKTLFEYLNQYPGEKLDPKKHKDFFKFKEDLIKDILASVKD